MKFKVNWTLESGNKQFEPGDAIDQEGGMHEQSA